MMNGQFYTLQLSLFVTFADVPLSARNILQDPEVKNAVKAYR